MKKLPLCTLLGGALFAIGGTSALVEFATRRAGPIFLFFPLAWDLVMVAIGVCIILRCDCARRAGLVWGVFCILTSLVVGATSFDWLLPQQAESTGIHRLIFMMLSVAFGLFYGVWQLVAFHRPEIRNWTDDDEDRAPAAQSQSQDG